MRLFILRVYPYIKKQDDADEAEAVFEQGRKLQMGDDKGGSSSETESDRSDPEEDDSVGNYSEPIDETDEAVRCHECGTAQRWQEAVQAGMSSFEDC